MPLPPCSASARPEGDALYHAIPEGMRVVVSSWPHKPGPLCVYLPVFGGTTRQVHRRTCVPPLDLADSPSAESSPLVR
jgi:hypothetical protein